MGKRELRMGGMWHDDDDDDDEYVERGAYSVDGGKRRINKRCQLLSLSQHDTHTHTKRERHTLTCVCAAHHLLALASAWRQLSTSNGGIMQTPPCPTAGTPN